MQGACKESNRFDWVGFLRCFSNTYRQHQDINNKVKSIQDKAVKTLSDIYVLLCKLISIATLLRGIYMFGVHVNTGWTQHKNTKNNERVKTYFVDTISTNLHIKNAQRIYAWRAHSFPKWTKKKNHIHINTHIRTRKNVNEPQKKKHVHTIKRCRAPQSDQITPCCRPVLCRWVCTSK